jgi:CheY-like chemotaxis protein
MSQITNGKLRLNSTCFSVMEILREVSKLIKFQAKRKGVKFELINRFPADRQRIYLNSDPNRLKQIILNLLGNALKFTEQGSIKLIVEPAEYIPASAIYGNQTPVMFTVEDTGCGIKESDVSKLFQLFGKLENSDSKRVNQTGIGLGLAISQNLVKCLNQFVAPEEIQVQSVLGKGSRFYFVLHPMIDTVIETQSDQMMIFRGDSVDEFEEGSRSKEPRSMNRWDLVNKNSTVGNSADLFTYNNDIFNSNHLPSLENSLLFKPPEKTKRVLLVDDDQINILVLSRFFNTFEDCVYDLAFNGQQAVDKVKSRAMENLFYDIIFMDCNMPVMDGFEATRNILELVKNNEIPKVPIVASTANASPLDYEKCFKNGMVDYISKPFSKAQVRVKIDSCLKEFNRAKLDLNYRNPLI